jgi:hypothetical protein
MFHTKGHFGPGAEIFNGIGRRLPFAGIAKAIDCVTVTKGWSRPKAAVQVYSSERRLLDRKAAIGLTRSFRQLIASMRPEKRGPHRYSEGPQNQF